MVYYFLDSILLYHELYYIFILFSYGLLFFGRCFTFTVSRMIIFLILLFLLIFYYYTWFEGYDSFIDFKFH